MMLAVPVLVKESAPDTDLDGAADLLDEEKCLPSTGGNCPVRIRLRCRGESQTIEPVRALQRYRIIIDGRFRCSDVPFSDSIVP